MLVNGKQVSLSDLSSPSLISLLESLKLKPEMVAVQRNGEIVKKTVWPGVTLQDGDRIEILKFVGGG
ncbi:thiamine biosynthesis protein ThiS [Leptospira fainei serovar Hurstbridge str. BUT 6]|uniref:Thiamine biosynthesis protein ThiS n=1 Tax=Leptospira fainei serovar Hurstbridge str. BUT 6 TaxID=1193011 RepID=S3V3K9_9LEPT|nr:sulfur carrier protein ThiS [Leptospira fainei]EPG75983.1 thiamine biosynthesis protein ThiS [Leptospira fainei serovar Hurstbridge str. BUT 6]